MIGKALPQEPVTEDRSRTATQSHTLPLIPDLDVCIAISSTDVLIVRGRGMRTAANLNTTLVLEPGQPDFSTDAGNSALISQQNLRAITQFQFGVTSAGG
jgi:hypothetical protein